MSKTHQARVTFQEEERKWKLEAEVKSRHTLPPVADLVALAHLSCSRRVGAGLHFIADMFAA